ncbi:MAG: TatD family hydrolase [Patescibacteria group bacterium]|jgi:TatD DNase family protein
MLIDTHCHLNMMQAPVEEVVHRASESGVSVLITQGTNLASSTAAVDLAHKFPGVFATVGIHPEDLSPNIEVRISNIEEMLSQPKVVGVGEVGLDYYIVARNDDEDEVAQGVTKQQQIELFKAQALLAIKHKKALVIHDREAVEDVIGVLQEVWSKELEYHTVFHCCPADERLLEFAVQHHIYIGIDGDISWSKKKQRFISSVPLELLVLETDSPFLIPLELKQIILENEPKNITIVRDAVARIQNHPIEIVESATTLNAHRLFSID